MSSRLSRDPACAKRGTGQTAPTFKDVSPNLNRMTVFAPLTGPLAQILDAHRARFNAKFAEARHFQPKLSWTRPHSPLPGKRGGAGAHVFFILKIEEFKRWTP